MDTKLLLVKAITLLYRESLMVPRGPGSAALVDNILVVIKLPDSYTTGDFGRDPLVSLRETARVMAQNPVEWVYDKTELLQRLRVNCNNDEPLWESLLAGIDSKLDADELRATCIAYRRSIEIFLGQGKIKDILKKYHTKVTFQPNSVDWRNLIRDIKDELEPYSGLDDGLGKGNKHAITRVNFSDYDAVRGVMQGGHDELDTHGVFKMGLQGLNRMFGPHGGLRRGESILTSALKFNYKSGMCLDMFRWAAIHNTPMLIDTERKPLLLRMSLENSVEQDILSLYKSLAENETQLPVDITSVDIDEATRYVIAEMTKTGFHIDMSRYDPSEMTYHDLFEIVEGFESDGYEVQFASIDYLNCLSKRGCAAGPAGVDIKDLYRRTRNFFNIRKTTFITPHQMSTDAKMLLRGNATDFVKEVVDKGYYEGCKGLDTEPDLEIHQHIVKVNGESYLTLQRGKHRKVGETRASDLYTVYKFEDYGNIPDDINGPDRSRRSVGGGTAHEGGAAAWWDGAV